MEGEAYAVGTLPDGTAHALDDADLRRGVLVRGGGSTGKTSVLLTMFASVVEAGRGCVFVDGKADARTLSALLARSAGRLADVVRLDLDGDGPDRATATCNPFAWMCGREMADLVLPGHDGVARVPPHGRLLVGAAMRALAFLRDAGLVDLDARTVRDHLSLRRLIDLSDDKKYPEMPPAVRADLATGLGMFPAYQPEKGYKQSEATRLGHAQAFAQVMPVLDAMCADDAVFGHAVGDVDMLDVMRRGRILLVTLPPAGTSRAAAMATLVHRLVSWLADAVAADAGRHGPPFPVFLDEALGHDRDEATAMLSRCGVGGIAVVASVRSGMDGPGWLFAGTRLSLPGDAFHGRVRDDDDDRPPRGGEYRYARDGHVVLGRLRDIGPVPATAPAFPGTVGLDLAAAVARSVANPFDGLEPVSESPFPEMASGFFPGRSDRVDALDAVRRAMAAAYAIGTPPEKDAGGTPGSHDDFPMDPGGVHLHRFLGGLSDDGGPGMDMDDPGTRESAGAARRAVGLEGNGNG